MKTLLRIDSSIRQVGSVSRAMGDHFVSHWKNRFPEGKVITRDLQTDPIPHLSQSTVQAFFSGHVSEDAMLSDKLIAELLMCEEIVITCPMYNFQIPSSLKAYLDHIVRVNRTFENNNGLYRGLLHDKSCYLLTAMGGRKADIVQEADFESYLRNILGFIGIRTARTFCVDGTAQPDYAIAAMEQTKINIINAI